MFNFFNSNSASEPTEGVWDSKTVTRQPTSPAGPSLNQKVVDEQPSKQESMQLRGGDKGGVCCGLCAGLACFGCCEICCC